ncbi:MAG: efflux RND transporter permease subunit [Hyphomicrobium sp.]
MPLSELAQIKTVNGASIIARRENQRQITVRTNIRGRDQGSFVADAQRRFRSVQLPTGYEVTWGGQFENLQRAQKRLTVIMPITIAIIFVLLFFMFGSPIYAGLVMMNVPFSLVGGILFLYLRHINLSVSAAVGFISLFGVAGDERRAGDCRNQSRTALGSGPAGGPGDCQRSAGAAASGAADDYRRLARHGARGARFGHWLRRAAAACHPSWWEDCFPLCCLHCSRCRACTRSPFASS